MGHKIRVSSRAIIIDNDKILLNKFGDGVYYNFPGGGIEENETALEAVVRELLEETGYSIEVENHVFTFEYEPSHCDSFEGNNHHISIFFRCKLLNDKIQKPTEVDVNPDNPKLIAKHVWIPITELNNIPFVPITIKDSLINYIKTGIFEPSFFEHFNPNKSRL